MFLRLNRPILVALALFASAAPGAAQQGAEVCARLQAQLASLGSGGRDQRLEADYAKARRDLDAYRNRSRQLGCDKSSFFGPRPPAECRPLEAQIERLDDSVRDMSDQVRRSRSGGGDGRRQAVISALAQNGCPGYQAAAPQGAQRRQGGLFGLLFGNRGAPQQPEMAPQPQMPVETPRSSTYRTVCVRTCDGFFFPVSYAAPQSKFEADADMCRRTCPGTEAQLFTYPNPGGTLQQATSVSGQPYTELPNAFKYQTQFVKNCSCKPANMDWAQALAGAEDSTVQSGDIVVDEQRARQMSQPGGTSNRATPAEAARAAQDSARSVTGESVEEDVENSGATEPDVRTANPVYAPETGTPQIYAPPPSRY